MNFKKTYQGAGGKIINLVIREKNLSSEKLIKAQLSREIINYLDKFFAKKNLSKPSGIVYFSVFSAVFTN